MQAYYGSGVQFPAPFSASVASGLTHPYIWSPQAAPVNVEIPFVPSTSKERGLEKNPKVLDHLTASIIRNAKAAGFNGNRSSERDNVEKGSIDGSDVNSESAESERKRNRCPEGLPNSASDATPAISLGMSSAPVPITDKPCTVFRANLTSGMDLGSSCVSKLKPGGEPNLPTRAPVEGKELKREKRKQSNRESARRSRLRRLAGAEELAVKFGTLASENSKLRSEITLLTESSDKLRSENSALMKKLKMVLLKEEDNTVSGGAPSILIENLLSRIDNCGPVCENNQMEEELDDSSNGKLLQLLDSNPRTDSIAAS